MTHHTFMQDITTLLIYVYTFNLYILYTQYLQRRLSNGFCLPSVIPYHAHFSLINLQKALVIFYLSLFFFDFHCKLFSRAQEFA